MAENETTMFRISRSVHKQVKNAHSGTGIDLQVFIERALTTYLSDHELDIKTEKEQILKMRGLR